MHTLTEMAQSALCCPLYLYPVWSRQTCHNPEEKKDNPDWRDTWEYKNKEDYNETSSVCCVYVSLYLVQWTVTNAHNIPP